MTNRRGNLCLCIVLVCATAACAQAPATVTIDQLEQRVAMEPGSVKARQALAEAYLHEVELEKSLAQWRAVLRVDPGHARARQVVARLTEQALDLDSYLQAIEDLLKRGVTEGTASLLDAAGQRASTDDQKSRIAYLRGRLAAIDGRGAEAQGHWRAAMQISPTGSWAGYAAIQLALDEQGRGLSEQARRRLRALAQNAQMQEPVRQAARLELTLIENQSLSDAQAVAALEALVAELTDNDVKRNALRQLIARGHRLHGRFTTKSVEAVAAIFEAAPPNEEAAGALNVLREAAAMAQHAGTLDRLVALTERIAFDDPSLVREARFIAAAGRTTRATIADDADAVQRDIARTLSQLDTLADTSDTYGDQDRIDQFRGRAYLVEAQKIAVLTGPTEALPLLVRARDHYLQAIEHQPDAAFNRLNALGMLFEHLREHETAVQLYRRIATRFAHTAHGRDALLAVARLYEGPLDAPMAALEVYAEYAARYPAELPYRQMSVGRRLQRLGYAGVLEFQKRCGLTPDGIFGPNTQKALERLEAGFDLIRADAGEGSDVLRGQFVHPAMFAIAERLHKAGRHHQAVVAYRLFLNLFPTKRQADDALIAVPRLFRDNLLFTEALGAYEQLMNDYPKGNVTSEAYIEAAQCLENIGRWDEARELYELYARKFPKYKHVGLAKQRLALLNQILQYEDFIASNPDHPKQAEAQYQIAVILYKQFKNHTKAAVEFAKVADRHAEHVRAADALFTAGTAQLRAENFPDARRLYQQVVTRYADSRLADDAQFWIGHTYEYAARALGKLDASRIVLKKRSLTARRRLAGDLELRRFYHSEAEAGVEVPEDIWGGDRFGVLALGSVRDRVNADLFAAIREYREVAEQFRIGDMADDALLRIGVIYTDYLNDPEKGLAAYQQLLASYPGSKQAVDALFEVGAYQMDQKKYDEAIKLYEQFIFNYPTDEKAEDAMIAIARAHVQQKAWGKALDAYQSYLNAHPEGRHAEAARAQVEWIRMYHF